MLPVYKDPIRRIPLDEVVFRQETRKGKDKNHTVPICSELRLRLKDYNPSINLYTIFLYSRHNECRLGKHSSVDVCHGFRNLVLEDYLFPGIDGRLSYEAALVYPALRHWVRMDSVACYFTKPDSSINF